jgi:hypothetical protein
MSGWFFIVARGACHETDGSFTLPDPFAQPNWSCRATDLTNGPAGWHLLLTGTVFGGPFALLAVAWIAARSKRQRIAAVAVALAALLIVAQAIIAFDAHLGYRGSG